MSPQFVDWNGNGRLDIVAGTFSGSIYVALATENGWQQPVEILDKDGKRIVVNDFWNYDEKKWDTTERCVPEGVDSPRGHGTSAFAFDWNGNGALDLLHGDYKAGRLYLRINEGTTAEPAFATRNLPVLAGGKPLNVGKLSTPRMADWNGDGLPDLLVGTMGDTHGPGPAGGVYLYLNTGSAGKPGFGDRIALIPELHKKPMDGAIKRPEGGLYMDVADLDGDGKLDLIVGGYSIAPPDEESQGRNRRVAGVWFYRNISGEPAERSNSRR